MDRILDLKELKRSLKKLQETKLMTQFKANSKTLDDNEESDLKKATEMIQTLSDKIRALSGKYGVEYIGELYDYNTKTYYDSELHTEILYFENICVIDTEADVDLSTNSDKINLVKEIGDYLYSGKYSNFKILRIKSLDN